MLNPADPESSGTLATLMSRLLVSSPALFYCKDRNRQDLNHPPTAVGGIYFLCKADRSTSIRENPF